MALCRRTGEPVARLRTLSWNKRWFDPRRRFAPGGFRSRSTPPTIYNRPTLLADSTMFNIIDNIVRRYPATSIKPAELFLSWHGVLTLVYENFSTSLLGLKDDLTKQVPGLVAENEGSKWPKTTLGVLKDDRVLTLEEITTLRDCCDHYHKSIARQPPFQIEKVSAVLFHCRSLEHRLITYTIPLSCGRVDDDDDDATVVIEHRAFVTKTMRQFSRSNLGKYLFHVQAGGCRETHYRTPCVAATLVIDIGDYLDSVLQAFIRDVGLVLPGTYTWFETKSRHITVRALS